MDLLLLQDFVSFQDGQGGGKNVGGGAGDNRRSRFTRQNQVIGPKQTQGHWRGLKKAGGGPENVTILQKTTAVFDLKVRLHFKANIKANGRFPRHKDPCWLLSPGPAAPTATTLAAVFSRIFRLIAAFTAAFRRSLSIENRRRRSPVRRERAPVRTRSTSNFSPFPINYSSNDF